MFTRRKFLKMSALVLPGVMAFDGISLAATVKRDLPSVNLKFISSEMPLMRRSKWTDSKPKTWLLREAGVFGRLTIHHTGLVINKHTIKNAVINDLQNILAGHIKKQYADIAYHFVIDYVGHVWEGRSLAYEGAHVADQNEHNIGVMLMGNFDKQDPSVLQLSALTRLSGLLCREYSIERHRIYGHSDLGASSCPGKTLYPHVKNLRKQGSQVGVSLNSKRKTWRQNDKRRENQAGT